MAINYYFLFNLNFLIYYNILLRLTALLSISDTNLFYLGHYLSKIHTQK